MCGKFLFLYAGIALLMGCTSKAPDIRAICLRDNIGNYLIKWETEPLIKGTVKMYVSDTPDSFSNHTPAVQANINDGIATYITNDNMTRKYFELVFNNKYYRIVGARSIVMDSVQNLRDMGGYFTRNHRMTRWGKLFRSGQLSPLSEWDSIRLNNLGIKTIIDLRTDAEIKAAPIQYTNANIIHIPISNAQMPEVPNRILSGTMRKGDAILCMQDLYLQLITNNTKQLAKALEEFQNPDNYPILFNCTLGKDRAGFLAAILLAAIGIPEDTILKDYMASNEYIDLSQLANKAHHLNSDAQEAITVFVSTNESFINLARQKIQKEYGSVDKYLSKGLQLDEKKRDNLKDILLY